MKLPRFSRGTATKIELESEVAAPLRLNKPCEAEDFRNLTLLEVMRRVYSHDVKAHGPSWPQGTEQRKMWEVAMAILAMEREGKMHSEAVVLGVGAGIELTIFYLTNYVRWVFATDLYATTPDEWATAAPNAMLTDPGSLSPIPFNPRRLVVEHMDGRKLRFEDSTFDAVFSSSSIEHFGEWEDVAATAREIGRVLKPGGLLTLSTELRVRGEGKGMPGVLLFSPDEFQSLIIGPSGLVPVDEPSWDISARTRSRVVTQAEMDAYYVELNAGRPAHWQTIPHIILDNGEYSWTSYHLALRKPD
jgi:SAM-dependent methyltransferase